MNPFRGDESIRLGGKQHRMRLSLNALATLETRLKAESLLEIVERIETGQLRARDISQILYAGLEGAETDMTYEDFVNLELDDGVMDAAQKAVNLLARAFRGNNYDP